MKKVICFLSLTAFALATSASYATTFTFDPNDLVDSWEGGAPNPVNGINPSAYPRSIYDPDNKGTSDGYGAYTGIGAWNAAGTGSALDTNIGNDFNAWRDNGGFITSFNIWLADNPKARGWGETLVVKPGSGISATADDAGLWEVTVTENEWYTNIYMADWTVKNEGDAIKVGGTDIGEFSFSAEVYVDSNQNGWDESDTLAVLGQDYTIWFGSWATGDSDFGTDDPDFGESSGGLLYQGTLDLTATPEPTSFVIWCLFGTCIAAAVRRRHKA